MVGTFDKPRFVNFDQGLCAHSRNKKTGCTRCLDLCPTGAITPSGKDWVNVSNEICAGCGACAAVCPTGAIQYALPTADALARRLDLLRALPGPPPLVADPDLSLIIRHLPVAQRFRHWRRDTGATLEFLRGLKSLHALAGGRKYLPRDIREAWL